LAFQPAQYLDWQNACYLRLIHPHPAARRRIFFVFATQKLFAMRSEAPLTKSAFFSSHLFQIDLLLYKHMDIFQHIHTSLGWRVLHVPSM